MIRLRKSTAAVAERDEYPDKAEGPAPEPRSSERARGGKADDGFALARPLTRQSAVNVKLIYAGLLVSLAFPPVALLAALFAHLGRQRQPNSWLATHYTYQIRTFWIGLCATLSAYALTFVGIGRLLLPLIAVWVVARAVHGIAAIAQNRPLSDPYAVIV